MASQLVLQIAKRNKETIETVGALRLADDADVELNDVREVLKGLAEWPFPIGKPCWCHTAIDEHEEICDRTRALYQRLRVES